MPGLDNVSDFTLIGDGDTVIIIVSGGFGSGGFGSGGFGEGTTTTIITGSTTTWTNITTP